MDETLAAGCREVTSILQCTELGIITRLWTVTDLDITWLRSINYL